MKNNANLIYSVFLVIGDFLALIAAFVVAVPEIQLLGLVHR
jgi:hypothetical protein